MVSVAVLELVLDESNSALSYSPSIVTFQWHPVPTDRPLVDECMVGRHGTMKPVH